MLWTSLTITAKMLYQLQLIKPYKEHYNCSYEGQYKVKDGLELGEWFGLKKLDDTSIASYIAGYIVIVVLIALVISANRYQVWILYWLWSACLSIKVDCVSQLCV
jgi:hypothetical protein